MAANSRGMKTEHLRLRVSSTFRQALDELCAAEGHSREETIRRAVALLNYAHQQRRLGHRLGLFVEDVEGPRIRREISI